MSDAPTRILVIFGTRPEAIKLFPVIAALKADPRFDPVVCVSAQHREMLDQVLEIAGIVPDHDLDLMQPGQTLDGLTAALLTGLGAVMNAVRPDRVMVQGDTATAMAGALAGYYRKIPVDHVEAGLRSGNIHHPWPEEVNRKIIGAMASLHFAPTRTAAEALLRENVDPARVQVTGNTVIDALHWVTARIAETPALAGGLAAGKKKRDVSEASFDCNLDRSIPVANAADVRGVLKYVDRCPVRVERRKRRGSSVLGTVVDHDQFVLILV